MAPTAALCPLNFGERFEKSFVDFAAIGTDTLISVPPLSHVKIPVIATGFHVPRHPGTQVQGHSTAAPSNPQAAFLEIADRHQVS
jgi:hypothetical protein